MSLFFADLLPIATQMTEIKRVCPIQFVYVHYLFL